MKPALFISDLHLAPERPATAAAFHAFTRGSARDAAPDDPGGAADFPGT